MKVEVEGTRGASFPLYTSRAARVVLSMEIGVNGWNFCFIFGATRACYGRKIGFY